MSEILDLLFGSRSRARLLRFFLLNPDQDFLPRDLAEKNMIKLDDVRRELEMLTKIKFVQERRRQGRKYYSTNNNFPYHVELKGLFVKASTYPQCKALGKIATIGTAKLVLVSGVFLNYQRSKVDLIIVADHVSRAKMKNVIMMIEAEIGKEVRYMLMSSDELTYRLNMTDRFLMEFLMGPHDEVINKVPKLKNMIAALRRSL